MENFVVVKNMSDKQFTLEGPMKAQRGSRRIYEGWKFNSGNYLFTTDTK